MSVKRGSIVIPKKLASLALCGESETCEVDLRHVYSYVILGGGSQWGGGFYGYRLKCWLFYEGLNGVVAFTAIG